MEYKAKSGQDLFDVCLQNYGSIEEGLFDLIETNDLTLNSELSSGQQLTLNNENAGLVEVKDFFENNTFIINNADEEQIAGTGGAYNYDFGSDFDNTEI